MNKEGEYTHLYNKISKLNARIVMGWLSLGGSPSHIQHKRFYFRSLARDKGSCRLRTYGYLELAKHSKSTWSLSNGPLAGRKIAPRIEIGDIRQQPRGGWFAMCLSPHRGGYIKHQPICMNFLCNRTTFLAMNSITRGSDPASMIW